MTGFLSRLERDLVSAASARSSPGRARRPHRRLRAPLLAGAALLIAVGVPAWAAGLLPFSPEQDHERLHVGNEAGAKYVLAAGPAGTSLQYRLVAYNSSASRVCLLLELRGARLPGGSLTGTCSSAASLPDVPPPGRIAGLRGGEARVGLIAPAVKVLRVTFRSGRELGVRVNGFDARRLKAAGLRFPFAYAAFAVPPRERVAGITAEGVRGRVLERIGAPPHRAAGAPVRNSPAL